MQSAISIGRKVITIRSRGNPSVGTAIHFHYGVVDEVGDRGREGISHGILVLHADEGQYGISLSVAKPEDEAHVLDRSFWIEQPLYRGDSICFMTDNGGASFWELNEDGSWSYTGS